MQPGEWARTAYDPIGDDRQPEASKARWLIIGVNRERGDLRLEPRDDMGKNGLPGERRETFIAAARAARSAAGEHHAYDEAPTLS